MIIKKQSKKTNMEQTQKSSQDAMPKEDSVELFDLDNIEFSQRQERRRGNRRRGYRRIDDRNLISRAQEEAGTIKETAAQEGYKAGLEKAQSDIDQLKDNLINFLNAKQEVFEYIAPDILEISIEIARKIVKKEIEQDPEMVLSAIMDVLKTVSRDEKKISLKVNPAQYQLVKTNMPAINSSLGLEVKTNIVSDDTIDIGGCILHTSNGIVDATVNTQLEVIKEAFKEI